MAFILHCDGCHAQDDSIDGNEKPTPNGAPVATNQAPRRIKVTRDTQVFGMKKDLCNRCIASILTVLQLPIDTPAIPEERKAIPRVEPRFDHPHSTTMPLAGAH
jgi:hypothetical protein